MLSYRHAYHAGNYADVLKHLVLVQILDYLIKKPGPVRYVDTHAGAGMYNLRAAEADKLMEYQNGIGLLLDRPDLPAPLRAYVDSVKGFNAAGKSSRYPGSPSLAQRILREQDKLDLCELHPRDFPALETVFKNDRRVHCHFEDGYKKSIALLPPREKRGLVLVDPSYEIKDDYVKVVEQIKVMHKRFATGVYALWYPVVEAARIKKLEADIVRTGIKRIHLYEVSVTDNHDEPGMTGTGMLVVNPPWQLEEKIGEALAYLAPLVSRTGSAHYRVHILAGE